MKTKKVFFAFGLFWLVLVGGFFTTRVVSKDFSFDGVKLITDMPSIRDSIKQHQKDARYVPYRVRLLVFNNSVYVYQILRNIANFWNLDNINKIMLGGNFYPLILGLKLLWLRQRDWFWICVGGLMAGSIVVGLNKMVDVRAASWFMLPILGYLIVKGLEEVRWKTYAILMVVSLFFLI